MIANIIFILSIFTIVFVGVAYAMYSTKVYGDMHDLMYPKELQV